MKNNKGYYSWIHSMKNAAMNAHIRGQEMLNEEKASKKAFDPKAFEIHSTRPPVQHGKPDVDPNAVKIFAKELGKTPVTPETIKRAGGDANTFQEIRKMKEAEEEARLSRNEQIPELEPAGDANDVEKDADDGTMADPDGEWLETISKLPSYNIAAQARKETEDRIKSAEEAEWEEREDARHWSDYTGRTGETYVGESVSRKINKILSEGDESEDLAPIDDDTHVGKRGSKRPAKEGSFSKLEVPFEISKKLSDSEKIGTILHMVNNPSKYHPRDVSWAKEALATMQGAFREE